MARPLRLQFDGALYHLTMMAVHRQRLFRDHRDKRRYLELLNRYRRQFQLRLYAYVLLGRHVHLLLETPKGNVGKVMQCLGTSYTQYFNRRHGRRGALFEGRYKSCLVEKQSHLLEVSRHIHRRHFHAALKHRRDYLWSSYPVYLGRRVSELVDVEPVLSRFHGKVSEQRRLYQGFVEAGPVGGTSHPCGVGSRPFAVSQGSAAKDLSRQERARNKEDGEGLLEKAEMILREVSLSLELNGEEELRQRRRGALGRYLAMYLIRQETPLPLRSIGELLGVKAPAVARGIGKVEELLTQEDFSERIKTILQRKLADATGVA